MSRNTVVLWSILRLLLVDSFSCGNWSDGKQSRLTGFYMMYFIIQKVLRISQNDLLIICVKISNSFYTIQFFHIPPNNVSIIPSKKLQFIFCILLLLYLFSCDPVSNSFESIQLKCYITTLLYTIAVNMQVLDFSSKKGFSMKGILRPIFCIDINTQIDR